MFLFLSLLLVYALASYGAVLSYSWFLLSGAWFAGFGGLILCRAIARRAIPVQFILLGTICGILAAIVSPKIAIGLFCGVWAWLAAKSGTDSVLKFFNFLIVLGCLEALLALAQRFLSLNDVLQYRVGTLINRNHFAGIMEMIIPVALGVAFVQFKRPATDIAKPYVYLLAGSFMALALLFSLSRSGIFSLLVTSVFMFLLSRKKMEQRMNRGPLLALGMAGLLTAGALWLGVDVIVQRYSDLLAVDGLVREGRMVVFRDTVRLIADVPLGVGPGKYVDVFRQYQTFHPEYLFDHAHNDYLETAAEWGLPLAVPFWAILGWIFLRTIRVFRSDRISPERRGILLACAGAVFAILVHSLTDFNLQIPSNAMLFFTLFGIALAQSAPVKEIAPQRSRSSLWIPVS